jgi:hypothetical protein
VCRDITGIRSRYRSKSKVFGVGLIRVSAPISTEGVALSIGMQSLILKYLSNDDVRIRMRVLGLLKFMITQQNLLELITQLLGHAEAASGEY